jgi:hypothetical protein
MFTLLSNASLKISLWTMCKSQSQIYAMQLNSQNLKLKINYQRQTKVSLCEKTETEEQLVIYVFSTR